MDSISTSSLSSCEIVVEGSSDIATSQQHLWEKFEDTDESNPPPLPPPRNELEELYSIPIKPPKAPGTKVEFTVVEESPSLDDLGPVAMALEDSVRDADDLSGSLSSSAAKDKWETFENSGTKVSSKPSSILDTDVQELSMSTILQPTTAAPMHSRTSSAARPSSAGSALHQSNTAPTFNHPKSGHTGFHSVQSTPLLLSGVATSSSNTAQPNRTNLNTSSTYTSHPRTSTVSRTHYINTNSVLRPIPQEGIASAEYITNPFYTGSINAGNYPALIPLPEKPAGPRPPNYIQNFPVRGSGVSSSSPSELSHKRPPTKPQPYSGSYTSQVPTTNNTDARVVVLRKRDSSTPFIQQRLPSLGSFDPFGELLGSDAGMASYVLQNPSTAPLQ